MNHTNLDQPDVDATIRAALDRHVPVPDADHASRARTLRLVRARHGARSATRTRRRAFAVAGAAAVCVAAIAIGIVPDGEKPGRIGTDAALAAQVRARMVEGLAGLHGLRATIETQAAVPGTTGPMTISRTEITVGRDRSFVISQAHTGMRFDEQFDARSRTMRSLRPLGPVPVGSTAADRHVYETRTMSAPDLTLVGGTGDPLQRFFFWGTLVRDALDEPTATRVTAVQYEGRAAWHITAPLRATSGFKIADQVDAVIDRRSGLALSAKFITRGRTIASLRIVKLDIDAETDATRSKTLSLPRGTQTRSGDDGYVRLGRTPISYQLPRATNLPNGFERVATLYAPQTSDPTDPGSSRPALDAVVQVYQRGLAQVTVTTRRTPGRTNLGLPFMTAPGIEANVPSFRVEGGLLDGALARWSFDLVTSPALWARRGDILVTISGDLTRRELFAAAAGLQV